MSEMHHENGRFLHITVRIKRVNERTRNNERTGDLVDSLMHKWQQ